MIRDVTTDECSEVVECVKQRREISERRDNQFVYTVSVASVVTVDSDHVGRWGADLTCNRSLVWLDEMYRINVNVVNTPPDNNFQYK